MWGDSSLLVPLMVDSSADDSFIDEVLGRRADLSVVELPEPCTVQDLDGRMLHAPNYLPDTPLIR